MYGVTLWVLIMILLSLNLMKTPYLVLSLLCAPLSYVLFKHLSQEHSWLDCAVSCGLMKTFLVFSKSSFLTKQINFVPFPIPSNAEVVLQPVTESANNSFL